MQTWIVRLVLAVLTLEAGICAAFLADDWKALRHQEEALFESGLAITDHFRQLPEFPRSAREILFESALALIRKDEQFILDPALPGARERRVRPLEPGTLQPYFQVPVTAESLASLSLSSLGPADWHILLKHMHEVGCQVAAIEQPLTWDGDEAHHLLALASLDSSIALYDLAVLTVDLQRVPNPQPIPENLRHSAIPLENVRGEVGALVRVNRVINSPSATFAPNIRFSFRLQESVEDATPAFVRWDDYLIPSFPLAVAMAQNDVAPEEVSIVLGRHIRLGDGPLVKIDEIGQFEMELVEKPVSAQLPADDVLLASEIPAAREAAGETVPRCVLFADATADNPAPWATPHRLQRIVSSFDVLLRPSGLERHQRLALWIELVLLGLIAAVAGLLVGCRSLFRVVGFSIHALLLIALLAALFIVSQRWMPLTPIVASCAVGYILSFRMARHLPARDLASGRS